MAVLKNNDVKKMDEGERLKKLEELRMELIKKNVHANKSGKIRAKEIKKAIARILTNGVKRRTDTKNEVKKADDKKGKVKNIEVKTKKQANKNNKNNTHK